LRHFSDQLTSSDDQLLARSQKCADILLKEASRKEGGLGYKAQAITAAASYVNKLALDRFAPLWSIVSPIVSEQQTSSSLLDNDDFTVEHGDDEHATRSSLVEKLYDACWRAAGLGWSTRDGDVGELKEMVDVMSSRVASSTVLVMAAMVQCLEAVLSRALSSFGVLLPTANDERVSSSSSDPLEDRKTVLLSVAQICRHVIGECFKMLTIVNSLHVELPSLSWLLICFFLAQPLLCVDC
jgi:hypothetical protein